MRYFGDYELLEEIARGGMGVVYKARQVSLNRMVAVKMILAGHLATEAEVKRFRTEAEAAANLQHPNIVAIHEIGEHQGQHYFSMDFVEGRNLAQLAAGKPLPAQRAAKYVKAIAEAIHFAHQRGTLHRDLKPQNVLIDTADQPRITDFGLAKQLKHDSSLTRSGMVMGSPSYMPPELAQGRHDLWLATHPETVFHPGFQPLLITAWFGLMFVNWPCGWAELKLRHHFRRHRELGTPIPRAIVRASILVGAVVILYCLALLFKQVEVLAWGPLAWEPRQMSPGGEPGFRGPLNGMLLVWSMINLITGAVLVWKAIGASELSAFSDLVARTMEAADAREEQLSKLRSQGKSFKERVLPQVILPLWVVLSCAIIVFWFGSVARMSNLTDVRPLKWVVWIAGQITWLLPAWLFAPWREAELRRHVVRKRAGIVAIALLGCWSALALAIGWPFGLALTLGGGSLGLLTAVAVTWTRQIEAQEKLHGPGSRRKGTSCLADVFQSDGGQFSAAGATALAVMTLLIGVATFQTWRNAAAAYALLDELSASGKALPRQSYALPRVPDAVNFAKAPVLQAIGYRAQFDTNRWARFVSLEALADPKGTFRLTPGTALPPSPGQTNVASPSRSARAAEVLRTLSPLDADLEELRQATARTFSQVDPAALDASLQDPNRPHSPGFRLLAQLFLVHAAAELALGSSEAAWRDLRVVQCLADALKANRRLDSTALRAELVQTCQESFWEGWGSGRWTQADLGQWECWLTTVDLLRDLDCSLRGEEPHVLNTIFDGPSADFQTFPVLPLSWIWFRDQRLYHELIFGYCDAAFDAARQQVYPARADAFQAHAARRLKENSTHWQIAYYHYPNLDPVLPKLAHVQTLVSLSRVAGALTRHRADTGGYPPTLEELAPRYLPKVPHDLIGGKPLIYRRTAEDKFLVYSVGWNERDDGGAPPESPFDLRHGDWVWPGEAKSGE